VRVAVAHADPVGGVTSGAVPGFVAATTWRDLPADVKERARLCLLDDLGALLAGLSAPIAGITAGVARRVWGGDEATIFFDGARAGAAGAAFANASAANGTDVDDCALYTWGHPGAQLFPAALAVAEREALPGAALLTGLVVGYEVAFRAGRCMHDAEAYYRSCGSWGSLACAATAANLLKMSEAEVHHALGIAEYHAPDAPMMRDVDAPAMVKHACGWGAMTGVAAAQLAAAGFTGIPSLLADECYAAWVNDIGETYLITSGVMWKKHSCCGWAHPALHALRRLKEREPFAAGDVKRIVVTAYRDAVRLGVRLPATTEEAQFNLAWPLAAWLVDGEISPAQVLEPRLRDAQVRGLAAVIEARESREFTRLYDLSEANDPDGAELAQVVVELADGRRLDSGPVRSEVYAEEGWDRQRMAAKFRWLTAPVLSSSSLDGLVEMVWGLDDVADARELVRAIDDGLRRRDA
jgi:2-methylcitrate dehydratase PrpD